jgi:hypothetical protein
LEKPSVHNAKVNISIGDIDTADCEILSTDKNESYIKILFESAYNLKTSGYLNNVTILIKNWRRNTNRAYVSEAPFKKGEEIALRDFEEYEIIQEIVSENESITFRGFSKKHGYWMESTFEECTVEVIADNREKLKP